MSLDEMRKNYCQAGLDVSDVSTDPMEQFDRWFRESQASDLPDWMEVNAATLSTASLDGSVSSRIVLLKGMEEGQFVFYTNYKSLKGTQLEENSNASLCFFWPHQERQVRVRGTAARISRERSEQYFHSRPRESQLGAWASQQSRAIGSREELLTRFAQLEAEYKDQTIPLPDHWGGFAITPSEIEFWQGRPGRMHDRLRYSNSETGWHLQRLCP